LTAPNVPGFWSIITTALQAVDDSTLEAAAAHISSVAKSSLTVAEIQLAFATECVLPRPLTTSELELIDQSKEDFRLGRTRTVNESRAYVDAELGRRRRLRASLN
jgi:hypothetical protein